MQIDVDARGQGLAVVNLQGRLDAAAAPNFKHRIGELISQGHVRLALQAAQLSFMDSVGLGALVSVLKVARKASGDISIIAPSAQVQKLLHLTAMNRVFKIFGSEGEALRQFQLSATSAAA
jgi:anti-sigma B factor antagonist